MASLFTNLSDDLNEALETVARLASCTKRAALEATIADRIDVAHLHRVTVRKAWAAYKRGER